MFSNVSLPLLIFLIIFSMIHFANASLEHAVELTEASKATGKSKKSLKVGKKTTYAPHPQNQLENLNLEMAQQLINEHHKNADPNELIREEKQSTELRSRNTFKVSEPHPISQQTPPVQQFNPSGDPYLSYLHHNHGGYQPPYLGAYASHYPSYGPPTAVPGSLLAQTTLTPDVNYVGPVVIPTVYDLFEYGYRQNYMPFAQTIPSTGHSVPGLENFGQSKGTGVYHDHFVRGGLPYMPSDHWEPSNEAESQLLYQQIPSEKVVPSNENYIPTVRISKPLVKEKNEPSSNKQVSESRKEIDSELEKEKSNRSLQVENNLYDNTYSKEKKKIDYMDENLNKRPEPKGIKTISTSKDKESMTQSVNQSNNFDSHSAPVDDSGQNIKGDSNKIDSGLDDENFYNDYPIQIGSIKIPTSRWRPRNAAESLSHVAQPAPSKKMDSSKNNLMDRILNPSEKEINKFLSENQVVESSKKTNIDKDQEKSSQTSPAPKKLINNTHEKKNKNIDEVDDMLNELPENRGLKKTLISEENESANQSVNQFNTHDLHSDPFSYSGQNLKGENNKINPGLKDKSFYGDYPTPRGVLENPISHWRPQNKAESGFHDAQTAQPNKFDSRKNSPMNRMRSPSGKDKILALSKNQVRLSSKKTDIAKDNEKLTNLNFNAHLKENTNYKDVDEKLNEQPKNQDLKTATTSKENKKTNQFINQPITHDSHSASVDSVIQDSKGSNKKRIFQIKEKDILEKKSFDHKIENSELSPKTDSFLLSRSSNKSPQSNLNVQEKNLMQISDDKEANPLKIGKAVINPAKSIEEVNETNAEKASVDGSKISAEDRKSQSNSPLNVDLNIPPAVSFKDNSKNAKLLGSSEKLKATVSKSQSHSEDLERKKEAYRAIDGGSDAFEEKSKKKFVEARPKRLKSPKESTKTKVGQRPSKKKLDTNNSEIVLKLDNDRAKQSDNEKGKSSSTVKVNSKNKLNHENLVQAESVLKKNTKSGKESFELSTESSSVSKKSAKSHYLGKNNERASKINLSEEYRHTYDKAMLYKEALFLLSEKDAMKLVLEDFPGIINHLIIVLIQAIAVVEKVTDKGLIQEIFNGIEGGASADPHNLNIAIKWIRNTISDSKELVEKEQCFNKMFFNWLVHKKNQETNGNNLIEKIHEVVKSHPLYNGN